MTIRNEPIAALLAELNGTDECEDLEAKHVSGTDIGKSTYETICALSNEPGLGGGTILLGVQKEEALFPIYKATGVRDPDQLSADIASGCASHFNQTIRVDIRPFKVGDATILKIDVPELPQNQKPLYFKSQGLPKGAFRRVGSADVRCTDEDLQTFFQGKANDPADLRLVKDASWEDLDPDAIAAYRKARSDANPLAIELTWTDEEMLRSISATQMVDGEVRITMAGLVVFGKAQALRRIMPTLRVDYIRVPGRTWVEDPDARYESLDMRGSIITLISRVIAAIADDLPKTMMIEDRTGKRVETPGIPVRVIREAVVNALMHRSYQTFQPIQIIRYANRIVIKNPGYSLKSQERFEEPGSFIRNPTIAEILHETLFAETKGSGIRVMQQKMKESGLASPTFESDRDADTFSATFLFHHFLNEADWNWLSNFSDLELTEDQLKALIFVREVGAIDNSAYRSLTQTDTLTASKCLRQLREIDLLEDRGSGARTHYVPGPQLIARGGLASKSLKTGANMDGRVASMDAKVAITDLPVALRVAVRSAQLKERVNPDEMQKLILRLCDWRPLSLGDLSRLLFRSSAYIQQKFVTPLIAEGKLVYLFPEMIKHPGQKYQTPRLARLGDT